MNRPFVAVVLGYVTGLLLPQYLHLPLAALFIGAFVCLVLALAVAKFRSAFLYPLLILAGWANLSLRTAVVSPEELRTTEGDASTIVTVRGQLAETPRLRISEYEDKQVWHSIVPVRASELCEGDITNPVSGIVMVNTPGVLGPNYFAGQPVEIKGVVAPPPRPLAEGLFDYKTYLANQGIYQELKTKSPADWKDLDAQSASPPLTDRFLHWAMKTLSLGLPAEDEPLHLLWAMTLGWRTAFVGDIGDPFLRAGTMHMFAIVDCTLLFERIDA